MVLVRHGVMIVGETCSGKTATIFTLANAMSLAHAQGHAFKKTHVYVINPKSVTSGQLYGLFDENTHEFVDGILAGKNLCKKIYVKIYFTLIFFYRLFF